MRNIFKQMGKSKYITWVLNIMLILMLFFAGIFIYWHTARYEVITPLEGNYELDKLIFQRGEPLPIRLRICKNLDYSEQVFSRFIDGVIYSLPDNKSSFDVQCYDTYLTESTIPETLVPGTYYYEEKIVYRVNPIKTVEYTFRTPQFEVVEKL